MHGFVEESSAIISRFVLSTIFCSASAVRLSEDCDLSEYPAVAALAAPSAQPVKKTKDTAGIQSIINMRKIFISPLYLLLLCITTIHFIGENASIISIECIFCKVSNCSIYVRHDIYFFTTTLLSTCEATSSKYLVYVKLIF